MVTPSKMPLDFLFGRTRSAVLGLLFSRPTERFHLRQIARLTGAGIGGLQRELRHLLEAGLLTRTKEGVQVYYQADGASPVFGEMKGLVLKTVGAAALLQAALEPLSGEINVAYLFGSLARGGQSSQSDADVLIVSQTLTLARVVGALRGVEAQLGREVNPILHRPAEFKGKLAARQSFLTRVMNEPRVLLVGVPRELGRMG